MIMFTIHPGICRCFSLLISLFLGTVSNAFSRSRNINALLDLAFSSIKFLRSLMLSFVEHPLTNPLCDGSIMEFEEQKSVNSSSNIVSKALSKWLLRAIGLVLSGFGHGWFVLLIRSSFDQTQCDGAKMNFV